MTSKIRVPQLMSEVFINFRICKKIIINLNFNSGNLQVWSENRS